MLHVVIRVLIRGGRSTSLHIVVVIVRLNEAVLRQVPGLAILQKLVEGSEDLGLILQQIDDLHGRAGPIVVVDLGPALGKQHALVDAEIWTFPIKDIHPDLAERRSIVSEGAITDGRPGDGGKPSIENHELRGQAGEYGKLV